MYTARRGAEEFKQEVTEVTEEMQICFFSSLFPLFPPVKKLLLVIRIAPIRPLEMRRLGHVGGVLEGGFAVELHADAGGLGHGERRALQLEIALEHVRQHGRRREDDFLRA